MQRCEVWTNPTIKVLGYTDDAALVEQTTDQMTARLTAIANASLALTDMKINVSKTYTQHVHRREDIQATAAEAAVRQSWRRVTSMAATSANVDSRLAGPCRSTEQTVHTTT